MGKLASIDLSIVLGYLIACLAIGFYKSKKIKNIKEYAVGNRNFSTLVMVSTLFATYVSAGRIGEISGVYTYGLLLAVPLLFMPLNWLIVKYLFARNIEQFSGCISMSGIMHQLYGNTGRYASNIAALTSGVGVITIQSVAVGLLFEYFFNINYTKGVFIGMSIVTLYSAFGGIRAVAMTDVFQFLIFFIALPITCGYSFYKLGSYHDVVNALPKSHTTLLDANGSLLTLFGFVFWMAIPTIDVPYIQRLLMAKSKKQLMKSYNIITVAYFFLIVVLINIGFFILTLHPNIESKYALYHYISHLPPIFVGIMVTGVLAIIMSSADSWLNTISVVIVSDVFKKFLIYKTDKQKLYSAKIVTLVCAALGMIFSNFNEQDILNLYIYIFSFSLPLYFLPLTIGFLGFRSSSNSFIFSVLLGFSGLFTAKLYFKEFGATSIIFSMLGSAIGFFGAHYYQYPEQLSGVLHKFVAKICGLLRSIIYLPNKLIQIMSNFSLEIEEGKKIYIYMFTGFFILLNIPIFMFGFTDNHSILVLRGAASLLCIILALNEFYPNKRYLNIYTYFTISFCLPFLSSYCLFLSGYETAWIYNFVITMVLFYILIPSVNFISLSGISILIGYICSLSVIKYYNYDPHTTVLSNVYIATYSTVVMGILVLSTIYYAHRKLHKQALSLETLGHTIAHDMGAPLSTAIIGTEVVQNAIRDKDYVLAEKCLVELRESQQQAMQDVQVMLSAMTADTRNKPMDWGKYQVNECLQDALGNLYMSEAQRKRVKFISKGDFSYTGSLVFIRHIMHNILLNAFKYAGEEAIIELQIKAQKRKIIVKDNGHGMLARVRDNIFEKYTTTAGHGVGLSFCREAMQMMGGSIECESKLGKGTEFILQF